MSDYPKNESGFFHLTPEGWARKDQEPFPENRVETWHYDMVCPAEDAKDRICMTRVWTDAATDAERRSELHRRFGDPLQPAPDRNIILECQV